MRPTCACASHLLLRWCPSSMLNSCSLLTETSAIAMHLGCSLTCPCVLQEAMYAPYNAEIDFSDEIAERDKHIESLKSEKVSAAYETGMSTVRDSRASSIAASDDADRDTEIQVCLHRPSSSLSWSCFVISTLRLICLQQHLLHDMTQQGQARTHSRSMTPGTCSTWSE